MIDFSAYTAAEITGVLWRLSDPVLRAAIPARDGEVFAAHERAKALGINVNSLEFPARYGNKRSEARSAGNTAAPLDITRTMEVQDHAR